MIAILNYDMGNLRSVQKALQYLGYEAEIFDDIKGITSADKIILPGVGAFCDAIAALRKKEFDLVLKEAAEQGKPILGICLGLHLLFDVSYENGTHKGLGLLPGSIVKLPEGVKAPHIGWNDLTIKNASPLLDGLKQQPYVYFVHSYYAETEPSFVAATTYYGNELTAVVQKGNIFACQFHPEKSGDPGLRILTNFAGM